jgi:hypothetical protein
MLIVIPVVLLFGTALSLALLRVLRPQFRLGWLMAVTTTSLAWLSVVLWQPRLPLATRLPMWGPTRSISTSVSFSITSATWPYALGLVTLVVAVVLTATARAGFPSPIRWAVEVSIAGLGLLAVAAGDPLTLALVWAALDLTELGLMLRWSDGRAPIERALIAFSVRLGGISLLLLAGVLAAGGTSVPDFSSTQPFGLFLLAAAALRLGVLPVPLPYSSAPRLSGGVGTTLQLTSAAASLVVFSRVAPQTVNSPLAPILVLICATTALYAGFMWIRAPDEFSGRPFWMMGLAGLALASSLRGNPTAATAWGASLVLAGGALFLSSLQDVRLNRALLIGAWSISALPFSFTAAAWTGNSTKFGWALPAFLLAQASLLAGFIHHATRPVSRRPPGSEQAWVRGAYPAGLGILLFVPVLLAFWGWDGALQIGGWIAGLVTTAIALGLFWGKARLPVLSPVPAHWLPERTTDLAARLYQELRRLYLALQRTSASVSGLLEGEAGIMWSLVLLALFVSLIAGRKP